jgi:hypothetical protein
VPVEVVEKFESRLITTSTSPSVELRYAIRGTNDDVQARAALVTGSPTLYDPWGSGLLFLPRDTVSIQPVGDMLWEGIVRYGTVPQTNESVFSFDTGGGVAYNNIFNLEEQGAGGIPRKQSAMVPASRLGDDTRIAV